MEEGNIVRLIKLINNCMNQYGKETMKDWDITPPQILMLYYLLNQQEEESYATDIHMKFNISKATISATLKKLRQNGYLKLMTDPADDRRKHIVLTDKAYRCHAHIEESLQQSQARLFRGVSQEDLDIMEKNLAIMAANIKQDIYKEE